MAAGKMSKAKVNEVPLAWFIVDGSLKNTTHMPIKTPIDKYKTISNKWNAMI